jgi:hypothetical protein
MFRNRKTLWIVAGAGLFLALALVTGAIVTTTVARAASGLGFDVFHRGPGGPGGPDGPLGGDQEQYLADALGITVDELQAARAAANDAALDQAVANGDLTQEQADAIRTLRDLDADGRGGRFGRFFGFHGPMDVDMDALLAAELGISVDELQAAREQASQAALDAAVANGDITQEQADLMQARRALKEAIDPEALTAQVLGISVDELQTAREAGTTREELLENAGLTAEEFRTALQSAYEAAVQQAVEDGVITQEQADQILANGGGFGPGFGPGFGRGRHGGLDRGGPWAPDGTSPSPENPPESPASTDSAEGVGL